MKTVKIFASISLIFVILLCLAVILMECDKSCVENTEQYTAIILREETFWIPGMLEYYVKECDCRKRRGFNSSNYIKGDSVVIQINCMGELSIIGLK